MWFKDHLQPDKTQYSYEEVCELVELYIARHDEEIAKLQAANKSVGQQDMLRQKREQESALFGNGIEVPDLRQPNTVAALQAWDGELNLLPTIVQTPFRRIPKAK